MKKILVLSAIVSACGSSSGSKNEPVVSNRPIVPAPLPSPKPMPTKAPDPDPNKRVQYRPAWISPEWSPDAFVITGGDFGNYGILPGEEPIADSMFRYFEAVRKAENWSITVNHGVKPDEYLKLVPKTPDGIVWKDNTDGKIPGFEKLRAVLPEMTKRCPSLSRPDLQAPLQVVWASEKDPSASGQFFSNDIMVRWENDRVTLDANTNLRPSIYIKAEYVKTYGDGTTGGWRWPKQTFKEITGGKTYADGGYTFFAIDQTFAHEFGHFVLQAWAMNNGRSNLQSQWFAEGWAEFFKAVCWGDFQDNQTWVRSDVLGNTPWDGGLPFSKKAEDYRKVPHRFSRGGEYDLHSLGDLITLEAYNGTYEPDIMLQAGLLALEAVNGRKTSGSFPIVSPVDGILAYSPHWTNEESLTRPEISSNPPVEITRSEWLEHFCDAYESLGKNCGHMRKVIEADAEGLRRDEY